MSKSLDPLEATTPELHRFYIALENTQQWYAVMQECRQQFSKTWRTMPKLRKKLNRRYAARSKAVWTWFDVPDPKFATYIALKISAPISLEDPGLQKINKSCF
jgi:hypothetical protein